MSRDGRACLRKRETIGVNARPRRVREHPRGMADCVGVDMAKRNPGPCSIEGCGKPIRHHGLRLCSAHHARFVRYGDPTYSPIPSAEARFWSKVIKGTVTDCWVWTGRLNKNNRHAYGRISVNGVSVLAHVFAYRLLVGPVPKGKELDHRCRNHLCVNPAHLEPVTHRENMLRGISIQAINARKTHCVNGHEFTPENTLRRSEGGRKCKTCQRAAQRAYKQRMKALA